MAQITQEISPTAQVSKFLQEMKADGAYRNEGWVPLLEEKKAVQIEALIRGGRVDRTALAELSEFGRRVADGPTQKLIDDYGGDGLRNGAFAEIGRRWMHLAEEADRALGK